MKVQRHKGNRDGIYQIPKTNDGPIDSDVKMNQGQKI